MIVRAAHFGFPVPDAGGAQATLYYPAAEAGLDDARLTGQVSAEELNVPWPVVILVPGINVVPDAYRWLAVRLVEAGFCAVTYSVIGSLGPAGQGITPGIDMSALVPDVVGSRCSATAIGPLLEALGDLDPASPPAGRLDLDRVALVGHSAGGTVALHNSDPDWIAGLRSVVSYGGHTMTSTSLGHQQAAVVKVPSGVPVLVLAGADDAVIAASRDRYRTDEGAHDPVGRTFDEAVQRDHQDSWMIELAEANHFTICHPVDQTSGRSYLQNDLRADDLETRDLLAQLVVAFLDANLRSEPRGPDLARLLDRPGITRWARR